VTDIGEVVLVVLLESVKFAVATTPSVTRLWLNPTSRQVYRPLAVLLQYKFFKAESSEGLIDTLTALKSAAE